MRDRSTKTEVRLKPERPLDLKSSTPHDLALSCIDKLWGFDSMGTMVDVSCSSPQKDIQELCKREYRTSHNHRT